MPQAPFAPRKDADELIAECRATLLSTVEETFRAMRMSDDAWLATARSAAGQRFDELSGIRDRRGFEIARGLTASRISLIHEEDLDFSIELTELARHLHDRLEAELIPLSQRMRIILSQTEVIPEQLPQGPETACEALRALAGAAGLETEARMKLLERLREPLAQHLGALYERQNKRLDEAGIKTSHAPPRRPAETRSLSPAELVTSNANAAAQRTALGRLQQALLARAPERQAATPPNPQVRQRLLAALEPVAPTEDRSAPANTLAQGTPPDLNELFQQLPAHKACTMEAVSQLFNTVSLDTNLPQTIRDLLGQLRAPLLRQALLNDRLLEDPDSMALALLDSVATVGYSLPLALSPRDDTAQALGHVVAPLRSPKADEITFSQALGSVALIAAEQTQRAIALGLPHHELAKRAERKEVALQTASKAIRALIQSDTHAAVRQLLETYWVHLLAQAASRHDANDQGWRERLETANLLIRSVSPHPTQTTRQALVHGLPGLIASLRKGLADLGLDEQKVGLALTPCMNLHAALIAGTPMPDLSWTSPRRPASLGGSSEPGGLRILLHGGHLAEEPRIPAALPNLAVGERVRAELADGTVFDGMVAWRAPRGQVLLLASPRTSCCLAISLRALTELAAGGKLRVGRPSLAERTASRVLAQDARDDE